MEKLFQAVYSGILSGSIYGLMAIGLTLIWGSLRMLNMAHGSLYLAGGFLAWTAINVWKLPPLAAIAVGVTGVAIIGLIIQVLFLNRVVGKPTFFNSAMIATAGLAIVIDSGALLVYGPRVKILPELIKGKFMFSGVVIQYQFLVIIAVSIVSMILLWLFLTKTRYGLAIQSVSQQMDAALLMGIPAVLVFTIVMVISAALAGLSGTLLFSVFQLAPGAGYNVMVKALVVTIFGGLGSVKGTMFAAYVIGLLEAFLTVYLGGGWALPVVFLFMIIILVVRPTGLFGLGEMQRL